jgi:hypothetical protein
MQGSFHGVRQKKRKTNETQERNEDRTIIASSNEIATVFDTTYTNPSGNQAATMLNMIAAKATSGSDGAATSTFVALAQNDPKMLLAPGAH